MKSPHLFASYMAYFVFGFGHETFRNSDPSLVMSFLLLYIKSTKILLL